MANARASLSAAGAEIRMLRERIADLESQLDRYRWRRVEEELPDGTSWSICKSDANTPFSAWYSPPFNRWIDANNLERVPTHWMPLPEPPKEEK